MALSLAYENTKHTHTHAHERYSLSRYIAEPKTNECIHSFNTRTITLFECAWIVRTLRGIQISRAHAIIRNRLKRLNAMNLSTTLLQRHLSISLTYRQHIEITIATNTRKHMPRLLFRDWIMLSGYGAWFSVPIGA